MIWSSSQKPEQALASYWPENRNKERIIWFSSRKLERALAENKLTNWGKVKYILVPIILMWVSGYPLSLLAPRYDPPNTTARSSHDLSGTHEFN